MTPAVARASGGLDVDRPEVDHVMRVSLGPLEGAGPRQIDAYTFSFGGRTYRGSFASVATSEGPVVVNTLPLDAYLYGVVSHEVSSAWPRAALQAQAIAARTYAFLRRRPGKPFDVLASTSDQFYGGVDVEEVPVRDAVDSTSGQFVLWNGAPAHVLYSSCCGGFTADIDGVRSPAAPVQVALRDLTGDDVEQPAPDGFDRSAPSLPQTPVSRGAAPVEPSATDIDREMANPGARAGAPPIAPPTPTDMTGVSDASDPAAGSTQPPAAVLAPAASEAPGSGEFPYLVAHADPHCTDAPVYEWQHAMAFDPSAYFGAPAAHFVGEVRSVVLREVDASGRPQIVRLVGTRGALDVDSADFRRRLGASVVRSTRLTRAADAGGTLSLEGKGFGHGVGMCQWGARGMAAAGSTSDAIVAFYFPGTTLGSV